MQIALIGYGKMGRLIEKLALSEGHTVCAKLNSPQWNPGELKNADVCMDFSHPKSAMENIKKAALAGKNVIMGTTGWTDQLDEVKKCVETGQIGFLHSPNFSIGVALFLRIVEEAARLFDTFEEYDIAGWECHHALKADSPSGTAKAILQRLSDKMERKKNPEFSSVRCGNFPGTHSVIFDSPEDTITLTHQARNREGFARGALAAAEWLKGRSGFYTLDDMLKF